MMQQNHTIPRIKICGITRLEDARYCAALGADYLGFIQYPESPRYVAPEVARSCIEWLYGPEYVGVFVEERPEVINRVAEQVGFTYVQVHGRLRPEDCARIERPVIRAFQVRHDASVEQMEALMEPYAEVVDYFLLDTYHTNLWGGTGESFNWRVARALASRYPLFLAGGLRAENLEEAIQTVRPFALDLSSSVEEAPGIKDFDKLSRLFEKYAQIIASLKSEEKHAGNI